MQHNKKQIAILSYIVRIVVPITELYPIRRWRWCCCYYHGWRMFSNCSIWCRYSFGLIIWIWCSGWCWRNDFVCDTNPVSCIVKFICAIHCYNTNGNFIDQFEYRLVWQWHVSKHELRLFLRSTISLKYFFKEWNEQNELYWGSPELKYGEKQK